MKTKQAVGGMNGRRAALIVAGSLLLVLLVLGYGLWLYSRIERSREKAATAWRSVASALSLRHRAFEKIVARGVDAQTVDMALSEKFRLAVDGFATTTQLDKQVEAAEAVEQQLVEIRQSLSNRPEAADLVEQWEQVRVESAELTSSLDVYRAVVRGQLGLRGSLGGKLLLFFIRLSGPREFRILAVIPNSRIL